MKYKVTIKLFWLIPVQRYSVSTMRPEVFAKSVLNCMGWKGWFYSVHIESALTDNARSWESN